MKKSNLKCIYIYAACIESRQHFLEKSGEIRAKSVHVVICQVLISIPKLSFSLSGILILRKSKSLIMQKLLVDYASLCVEKVVLIIC